MAKDGDLVVVRFFGATGKKSSRRGKHGDRYGSEVEAKGLTESGREVPEMTPEKDVETERPSQTKEAEAVGGTKAAAPETFPSPISSSISPSSSAASALPLLLRVELLERQVSSLTPSPRSVFERPLSGPPTPSTSALQQPVAAEVRSAQVGAAAGDIGMAGRQAPTVLVGKMGEKGGAGEEAVPPPLLVSPREAEVEAEKKGALVERVGRMEEQLREVERQEARQQQAGEEGGEIERKRWRKTGTCTVL